MYKWIWKHQLKKKKSLTHRPTSHFQPIIHDSNQECDLILAPLSTVHLLIHTPSSITASGPMVTFGPILQLWPILALGSLDEMNMVILLNKAQHICCFGFCLTINFNHSEITADWPYYTVVTYLGTGILRRHYYGYTCIKYYPSAIIGWNDIKWHRG